MRGKAFFLLEMSKISRYQWIIW